MNRIKQHKKKLTIVLSVLLACLLYLAYQQTLNQALAYVSVPVANTTLHSGTKITKDDIRYERIPKSATNDLMVLQQEDLIDHYIQNYSVIAKGSYFYDELIVAPEDIKDISLFSLKENEVAISIDVDMKSSYANAIKSGHYIDVYYSGFTTNNLNKDKKIVYGPLVNGARVIGVKDKGGKSVETSTSLEPSVLVLALSYKQADLVQRAQYFGEVRPIISFDTLNQKEANYYDLDKIEEIIYAQSLDVSRGN